MGGKLQTSQIVFLLVFDNPDFPLLFAQIHDNAVNILLCLNHNFNLLFKEKITVYYYINPLMPIQLKIKKLLLMFGILGILILFYTSRFRYICRSVEYGFRFLEQYCNYLLLPFNSKFDNLQLFGEIKCFQDSEKNHFK